MGSIQRKYGFFDSQLITTTRTVQETLTFFPFIKTSNLAADIMRLAYEKAKSILYSRSEKIDCESIIQALCDLMDKHARLGYDWLFRDNLPGDIKFIYTPTVRGGDFYNLNIQQMNENHIFEFDLIQIAVGVYYKTHVSNCIRTILINPTEQVKDNYNFMRLIERVVLYNLRDGVELHKVYKFAIAYAQYKNKHLAKHLIKNFGCLLNSNLQDDYIINSSTKSIARYGMIFGINICLIQLNEGNKYYNLNHANTVLVRKEVTAEILTRILLNQNQSVIYINNARHEDENG